MKQVYLNGLTYLQYDFKRIFEDEINNNEVFTFDIKRDGREWVVVTNGREFVGRPSQKSAEELVEDLKAVLSLAKMKELI